jgi:hypothetical protein
MNQSHARGYAGEQSMGFFFGERGYYFVEGPSGASGHGVTSRGFDGVAYNSQSKNLIIYDNKSFARSGNVSAASAIDPSKNLLTNLKGVIGRVEAMKGLPDRDAILSLLKRSHNAIKNGSPWPSEVHIAISNASGRSKGLSKSLQKTGIRFIDYYGAPRTSVLKPGHLEVARNVAIGKLVQIGDTGLPVRQSSVATKTVKVISAGSPTGRFPTARAAIRIGAKTAVQALAEIALMFLVGKLRAKADENFLRKELKKLDPKIEAALAERILWAVHLAYTGITPWANVTVTITTVTTFHPDGAGGVVTVDSLPMVSDQNLDVNVTGTKKEGEGKPSQRIVLSTQITDVLYTYSFEVNVPAAAVEFYRSVAAELAWYQTTMSSLGLGAGDAEWLIKERELLLNMIADHFGLRRAESDQHLRSAGLLGS